MVRAEDLAAHDRHHFFSLAARAMRQVVIDQARRRGARRRPDRRRAIDLGDVDIPGVDPDPETSLALDAALRRLERMEPELCRLVELRLFAGLTLAELEPLTNRSAASLKRDWTKARSFLARELGAGA